MTNEKEVIEIKDPGKPERERWSGRLAFYMAAVGSAVGFGNVWRFPSLAQSYGGGAFFIPYLLALFFIGIPILFLEIGLGQFHQTGDVGVFGSFQKRLRGVGLSSIACSYIVVTYYSMLIAWVINGFFDSFTSSAPWTDGDVTASDALGYFLDDIIGMSTLGDDLRPTRLVGANVGYSFLTFLTIFLCVAFGVKVVGRIALVTMGLPILFLFVFLGRAVSLEGSEDGITEYIGRWDTSVLSEQGDVWSTAVSQIFFSIGVTFGTMTAYGSHCPPSEPAFMNTCVVALSNSAYSFIAGFAVFAALGHLAYLEDVAVTDLPLSGFGLVFGTWPVVLGTLPGGDHWVRLLFVTLFMLGIDSAFSLLEALLTVARDAVEHKTGNPRKQTVAAVSCVIAWLCSLIYATDAGLIFLDVVDFYINFVLLFVGFLEAFSCGWMYGIEDQVASLGGKAVLSYFVANFGSVLLGSALWFGLEDNAVWAGFVGMILFYIAGIVVTMHFLKERKEAEPEKFPTWSSIIYEISFKNIMDLKAEMEPTIGIVPVVWCFLIKQFIPHVLLVLFINLAQTESSPGEPTFGNYEGYVQWPFQSLGYLSFAFACILFLGGVFFPDLYGALIVTDTPYSGGEEVAKDGIVKEEPELAVEEPAVEA